jgi:Ni,Fe-hydrogenase III component G
LNSIKREHLNNEMELLHVSENDGHHRKAANNPEEIPPMYEYYIHVLSSKGQNTSIKVRTSVVKSNRIVRLVGILLWVPVTGVFLHIW